MDTPEDLLTGRQRLAIFTEPVPPAVRRGEADGADPP